MNEQLRRRRRCGPRPRRCPRKRGEIAGIGGQHGCPVDFGVSRADVSDAVASCRASTGCCRRDPWVGRRPSPLRAPASTRFGAGRRGGTDRQPLNRGEPSRRMVPAPRSSSMTGLLGRDRRGPARRARHRQSWPSAQSGGRPVARRARAQPRGGQPRKMGSTSRCGDRGRARTVDFQPTRPCEEDDMPQYCWSLIPRHLPDPRRRTWTRSSSPPWWRPTQSRA